MTHSLLDGPALDRKLKAAIKNADQVKLAVAFWGRGASDRLGLKPKAKIICNLTSGGTNPDEIRKMQDMGIVVRQHNRLHAKIGCIGKKMSFVGSSNMSANGLGDEGHATKGWEESNVFFPNVQKAISDRFCDLWKSSDEITDDCLKSAEGAWKRRKKTNEEVLGRAHQLGSAKVGFSKMTSRSNEKKYSEDSTENKSDEIYIVVWPSEKWSRSENRLYDAAMTRAQKIHDPEHGPEIDFYWDWPDLPPKAYLLDFWRPTKGPLGFNGVYERDESKYQDFIVKKTSFQVVKLMRETPDIPLIKEKPTVLKKAVLQYMKANPEKDDEGWYYFPASKLEKYIKA